MKVDVPGQALSHGFRNAPVGTHSSRTIMVPELTLVLAAAAADTPYGEYRRLVIEENAAHKATRSGRAQVFRRLAELYALRPELPSFRTFRALWDADPESRPLLALLLACARDPLLRASAGPVLAAERSSEVQPGTLAAAVEEAFPDRYGPGILASIGRHTIASWAQAGHLVGKARKRRATPCSRAAAVAYALLLGHLCGAEGARLFDTFWAAATDRSQAELDALAFAASQRGWIEYRRIGKVVEIGFRGLMGR